jgi:hypothetical protein
MAKSFKTMSKNLRLFDVLPSKNLGRLLKLVSNFIKLLIFAKKTFKNDKIPRIPNPRLFSWLLSYQHFKNKNKLKIYPRRMLPPGGRKQQPIYPVRIATASTII